MKCGELRGHSSYYAQMAFIKLMVGLFYAVPHRHESIESFLLAIDAMNEKEQERAVREAVMLVELEENEVMNLIKFCSDKNGVPYTKENLKNLTPTEIREIIFTVCLEVAKIRIDFATDTEKKN